MDILNALTVLINFTVIPALAYGSQLALGAIFVTLIYAVLRFANFATGDMMSFGTMFAVLLTYYFQTIGINFGFLPTALLTIPFAIMAMIIFDERFMSFHALGALFILSGILISNKRISN